MVIKYNIYKSQRIVPVIFKRATTGKPVSSHPDLDNRGYFRPNRFSSTDRGPVVGVTEGKTVLVNLERVRISPAAKLFITSSDPAVMTTVDLAGSPALRGIATTTLVVKGLSAPAEISRPSIAKVEVRYGSITGPIISELSVWVWKEVRVDITPHLAAIGVPFAPGVAPTINIAEIMKIVSAIWEPCGVSFYVNPAVTDNITFGAKDVVDMPTGELAKLFLSNWKRDSINVYFVERAIHPTVVGADITGMTFSREKIEQIKRDSPHNLMARSEPGILLANRTSGNTSTDIQWFGNDLAHEIGHFLGLDHVDGHDMFDPARRSDIWSLRMLMDAMNPESERFNYVDDVGYGYLHRGALVTMKDLKDSSNTANHSTDAECLTVRKTLKDGAFL